MRSVVTVLAVFGSIVSSAQEVRHVDFGRHNTVTGFGIRLDVGMGVGGCQGSYLKEVDWTQVTNRPHRPERTSFWPSLYAELEARTSERLGFVAHFDHWGNGRSIDDGGRLHKYNSYAQGYLVGGRWYHDRNTPKVEWYSGMMAGWSHNWSTGSAGVPKVNTSYFAHQLTFIGFRTRGLFASSVELGQGYRGFLSFGMSLAI